MVGVHVVPAVKRAGGRVLVRSICVRAEAKAKVSTHDRESDLSVQVNYEMEN